MQSPELKAFISAAHSLINSNRIRPCQAIPGMDMLWATLTAYEAVEMNKREHLHPIAGEETQVSMTVDRLTASHAALLSCRPKQSEMDRIAGILACEIECGVFEQYVAPALDVARKVMGSAANEAQAAPAAPVAVPLDASHEPIYQTGWPTPETVRGDAFEAMAKLCDEQAREWDSDAVVLCKNYARHCAALIRGLAAARATGGGA